VSSCKFSKVLSFLYANFEVKQFIVSFLLGKRIRGASKGIAEDLSIGGRSSCSGLDLQVRNLFASENEGLTNSVDLSLK